MTSTSHIPVVDLAAVRALDPAGLREAAAAIRDACTSIGFFYISNHGVPTDVLEGAVKAAREFRHIGLEVVAEVPIAQRNDFAAILTLNQKLQRLTGRGMESRSETGREDVTQVDATDEMAGWSGVAGHVKYNDRVVVGFGNVQPAAVSAERHRVGCAALGRRRAGRI